MIQRVFQAPGPCPRSPRSPGPRTPATHRRIVSRSGGAHASASSGSRTSVGSRRDSRDLQVAGELGRLGVQHVDDRPVHPHRADRGEDEEDEEGARREPEPGLGVGEQRREEEASESAQHAHQSADGADVVREVLGDVLEDGRLADAHRAPEQEDEHDERHQSQRVGEVLRLRAVRVGDDDVSVGHHQQTGRDEHGREGPVDDAARPEPVGERAAEGPQQRRRKDVGGREQRGGLQPHVEVVHVVGGQPRGQRDVRAEHGHVVEAEAPHPHLAQRTHLLAQGPTGAGGPVLARGAEPHQRGHRDEQDRVDHRYQPPSAVDEPEVRRPGGAGDQRRPDDFVTEAPTLPAPNSPRAKPWCSRGCHAEFQAMPAENALPANPTRKASTRSMEYDSTRETR